MKTQIIALLLASFCLCYVDADDWLRNEEKRRLSPSVPASQVYKTVLMRRLLAYPQYDKDVEPPVTEGNGNTTVRFGLNLLCATPADDFVIVESWVLMFWKDGRLSWDPSEYGGVDKFRVSPRRIWTPDIRLYNAVKSDVADVMAVVDSNGTMLWMSPVNFFIRCQDGPDNRVTHCGLKFGSWTYSSDIVDIRENQPGNVLYLDDYGRACPSIVRNHTSSRNSVFYSCCPEPYNDVTITLELAWRESANSRA